MQWVCSDVTRDTNWQEQVQRADWVIDTVGILFENPRKENLSTANSDASEKSALFSTTKSQLSFYLFQPILFLSFEKIYMDAKLAAEELIHQEVAEAVIFILVYL